MGIFEGEGLPAWRRWHQLLSDRFGVADPNAGDVIQPLAVAAPARFDVKPKELGRYLETMYADTMPQWSPLPNGIFQDSLYIPTGASLSKGYRTFLHSLTSAMVKTASPEQREAIRESWTECEQARDALIKFDTDTNHAWAAYKRRNPTATRSVWERDNFVPDRRRGLLYDRNQTLATYMKTVADAGQADATLVAEQIIAMEDPTQVQRLPNTPRRANEDPPETWDQYYRGEFTTDFNAFKDGAGISEKLVIEETQRESSYFETRWSAGGSASFLGLFRVGGLSVESQKIEEHIRADTTRISLNFDKVEEFPIMRGAWYDEQIIRRYLNKVPANEFWEANGHLNLIPRSLVIVKGMSVTIEAKSETLDRLESHLRGSADVSFWCGWVRVGAGAGGGSDRVEIKHNTGESTMTLQGPAEACYVLAVRSWRPLDLVGKPRFYGADDHAVRLLESEARITERYLADISKRVLSQNGQRMPRSF